MSDLGVPPGSARRWSWLGLAVLGLLFLMTTAGVVLLIRFVAPGNDGFLLITFFGAFLPLYAPLLGLELDPTTARITAG